MALNTTVSTTDVTPPAAAVAPAKNEDMKRWIGVVATLSGDKPDEVMKQLMGADGTTLDINKLIGYANDHKDVIAEKLKDPSKLTAEQKEAFKDFAQYLDYYNKDDANQAYQQVYGQTYADARAHGMGDGAAEAQAKAKADAQQDDYLTKTAQDMQANGLTTGESLFAAIFMMIAKACGFEDQARQILSMMGMSPAGSGGEMASGAHGRVPARVDFGGDAQTQQSWDSFVNSGAASDSLQNGKVILTSPMLGDAAITSGFGLRDRPTAGASANHMAVDFGWRGAGDPKVGAAAPGVVSFAGSKGGYGNVVMITHADGTKTQYSHLASFNVKVGQTLQRGEQLGIMGATGVATGPHLDFKHIMADGTSVQPVIAGYGPATKGMQISYQTSVDAYTKLAAAAKKDDIAADKDYDVSPVGPKTYDNGMRAPTSFLDLNQYSKVALPDSVKARANAQGWVTTIIARKWGRTDDGNAALAGEIDFTNIHTGEVKRFPMMSGGYERSEKVRNGPGFGGVTEDINPDPNVQAIYPVNYVGYSDKVGDKVDLQSPVKGRDSMVAHGKISRKGSHGCWVVPPSQVEELQAWTRATGVKEYVVLDPDVAVQTPEHIAVAQSEHFSKAISVAHEAITSGAVKPADGAAKPADTSAKADVPADKSDLGTLAAQNLPKATEKPLTAKQVGA